MKYVHLTNFFLKQMSRICKPEGKIYQSEEPGFNPGQVHINSPHISEILFPVF